MLNSHVMLIIELVKSQIEKNYCTCFSQQGLGQYHFAHICLFSITGEAMLLFKGVYIFVDYTDNLQKKYIFLLLFPTEIDCVTLLTVVGYTHT